MNVIQNRKNPRRACSERADSLLLRTALLTSSLIFSPAALSATSLNTAVNNAVDSGCVNLDPVGANLASFCSNVGAADSSTGGTITSQISLGAPDKKNDPQTDLARVDLGPVSTFLSLDMESHEKDETAIEGQGFESDGTSVLVGLDYRVNDHFSLGVAFSYATVDGDFDGQVQGQDSGGFDNNSYGLMVIGDHSFATNAYTGWSLGYNNHEYETNRYSTVTMGGNDANGVLESDTSADELKASVEVGFDMATEVLTIGPRFGLQFSRTDIDGYTETVKNNNPAGTEDPLALIVDDQTETSLTSHLGIQFSKALNWDYGVLVPQLYLDYVHEFRDDQRSINFAFVGDDPGAGNTFTYNNDQPDRNYGNVQAGLVGVFPHGLQSFISYDRMLAYSDHENAKFSLGVRMEF